MAHVNIHFNNLFKSAFGLKGADINDERTNIITNLDSIIKEATALKDIISTKEGKFPNNTICPYCKMPAVDFDASILKNQKSICQSCNSVIIVRPYKNGSCRTIAKHDLNKTRKGVEIKNG